MARHRFRHRIGVLVALAGAALVAVTIVTLVLGRRCEQELSSSESSYVPLLELDRDLKPTFAQLGHTLEDAASAAEDSMLDAADVLARKLVERIRADREVISNNGGDPDALERELVAYYAGARALTKAILSGRLASEATSEIATMQKARDAFNAHLDQATAFDRHRLAAAFSTARRSQEEALRIEVAVAAVALVLMIWLSLQLTRRTVRSLLAVSEGVEQLARGEFGNEIAVTSNDEIGDLARQANRTALRLREYRDHTQALVTETRRQAELLQDANADLQRTGSELREKIADLENVSNTLSHDLRAPLRSIRAFSEVLAESLHDNLGADARDALQRVLRGGERMGRMIDDLYRLLRLSGAEVSAGEVSISAVLHDVTQNLKTDLEQAGATVTHGELPTIRSNALLIGQILQNLIANAIKFHGPDRPVVAIDVLRRSHDWEFSVRDNGIGIAPSARERVFRLFERLSSSGPGTGVGLALCKRAVEKLGGRIWIDPREGPGTTFAFAIPHEPQASASPRA